MTDTEIPATRRSEKASEDSSARGNSWRESTEIESKKKIRRGLQSGELQGVIGYRSSSMDWLMKVFQKSRLVSGYNSYPCKSKTSQETQ